MRPLYTFKVRDLDWYVGAYDTIHAQERLRKYGLGVTTSDLEKFRGNVPNSNCVHVK